MRMQFVRTCFFLMMALTVSSPRVSGAESDDVDAVLKELEKKYDTTDAFSYRFVQTQSIAQILQPLTSEGTLIFRKPHFIKLELRGEENLNLYVNGEKIWLEDLDFDEVEIFDFRELGSAKRISRLLPPTIQHNLDEIKKMYSVRFLRKEGNQSYIEMTPRIADKSGLEKLQFSVDNRSRICWMRSDYANGDSTETLFREWKKLPRISKYLFEYRPDSGK